MDHEITYRPSFALPTVDLAAAERLRSEAGAMVSMSAGVDVETEANGGVLGSLNAACSAGSRSSRTPSTPARPAR